MSNVFISYRRKDTAAYAGRLCDRFSALFGRDNVFMDVQDIQPGQDFVQAIQDTVRKCHVLIGVIGPNWLKSLRQRSGDAEDLVEEEISEALRRNITVIPVLVNNAKMPEADELPADLQTLSRRQAVELRDSRFDDDFGQLTSVLKTIPGLEMADSAKRSHGWLKWAGVAAAAVLAILLFLALRPRPLNLNGAWIAEMHKKGQPVYRIRLDLVVKDNKVNGTVDYPTGTGVIGNGAMEQKKLSFQTVHTPQFESTPATVSYEGEATEREIRLTSVDSNGVATGVAQRIR